MVTKHYSLLPTPSGLKIFATLFSVRVTSKIKIVTENNLVIVLDWREYNTLVIPTTTQMIHREV